VSVLRLRGLTVRLPTPRGLVPVVEEVDLDLAEGEVLGLLGESGSGKSTLAHAILQDVAPGGTVEGEVSVEGLAVGGLGAEGLRRLRGGLVALVPQDPGGSLTPVRRIGALLAEAAAAHRPLGTGEANAEALRLLARVRLPPELASRWPHQVSGGQAQRVAIALGLASRPRLLVLDEPTTGLDATVAAGILDLLRAVASEERAGLLVVSHDVGVLARIAGRLAVMYAGRVVETGETSALLARPRHPYTRGLLAALPSRVVGGRLRAIGGQPPSPGRLPPGCAFAPRCPHARPGLCDLPPAPAPVPTDTGFARCRRLEALEAEEVAPPAPTRPVRPEGDLLTVEGLSRVYRGAPAWLRRLGLGRPAVVATRNASFRAGPRTVTAMVGESGSGKSTVARILVGLDEATAGRAPWSGRAAPGADLARLPARRRPPALVAALQIVFQNPDATLNPAHSVGRILARAARRPGGLLERAARRARARELLAAVLLPPETMGRRPRELSGGQRQRVAIARALAGRPELVVADEPVSALDASVQAAVMNLLADLRDHDGTALLLISHDLALVRHAADRVVVMLEGVVVEEGSTEEVLTRPCHPYTEALLAASFPPPAGFEATVPRRDATSRGAACPFAARCHRRIGSVCDEVPPPRNVLDGHMIACHHDRATLSRPAERATWNDSPI
jgi:peptide/nickel transport system ATP-binding protein